MKDLSSIMQGVVKKVPLSQVIPDSNQPRQEFDEMDMEKLQASIRKQGILTPITVEPKKGGKYLIIDGERRYRCSKNLKAKIVLVNILKKSLTEAEKNITRFHLQETHTQWTVFEKAEAMAKLKDALKIDETKLARALSLNVATCTNYLAVLQFPIKFRKLAIKERLPFSYLRQLVKLNNLLPSEVKKDIPQYINVTIKKYKEGFIVNAAHLGILVKLVKNGELNPVKRFFKELPYTAQNALNDSDIVDDSYVQSVQARGKSLIQDIRMIHKNKLEVDDITEVVLRTLIEEINKVM